MATDLRAIITVQIGGAATQSATHSLKVEAYDLIDVVVPAESGGTAGEVEVEVQPGGAGQVQLLMITADSYGDQLTYSVADGSSDVRLNAPQLMAGGGAVGLLGNTQNTITFSNATTSDVAVRILVGRDATPE